MEEEWFQACGKTSAQDVQDVMIMNPLKILMDILKELKLLRKDLKK